MKRILKTNFLKLDQQKQTQMKINQLTESAQYISSVKYVFSKQWRPRL